jgi:hypothetical protein
MLKLGILHYKQLPWLKGQALYSAKGSKIKIMARGGNV